MKSNTLVSAIYFIVFSTLVFGSIYVIFQILEHGIEEIGAYNYPEHNNQDVFYDKFEIQEIINEHKQPEKKLRDDIIVHMIAQGFTGRNNKPYQNSTGSILPGEDRQDIYVDTINNTDSLDVAISIYMDTRETAKEKKKPPFLMNWDTIHKYTDIDLFRNKEDIDKLSYRVVSHRSRKSYDPEYRRFNISTALQKIGKVRVIAPGEEISYMDAIEYDGKEQKNYKSGYTVVLDEEQEEYGGGLCGASTAIYQGILTNNGLEIAEQRNHSKWFSNLYKANINGESIGVPGLDSTVYNGQIDLKIKNIRSYPIILVTDFDGEYGGIETVFTLGSSLDEGNYTYSHSYPIKSILRINEKPTPITGTCYHWDINGEDRQSCYKVIDNVKRR